MSTSTGKVMRRKIGGNRYTLRKRARQAKRGKVYRDAVLSPAQYRAAKRSDRAAKQKGGHR